MVADKKMGIPKTRSPQNAIDGMSTSSATGVFIVGADSGRPSDGRPVEDEHRGSAPASRTVAFLRELEIPGAIKERTPGLQSLFRFFLFWRCTAALNPRRLFSMTQTFYSKEAVFQTRQCDEAARRRRLY
jgi:hypothetical protein